MGLTIQGSDLGTVSSLSSLHKVHLQRFNKHCTPRGVNHGHCHWSGLEFLIYRFINIRQLQAAAYEIKQGVARQQSVRDVSSSKHRVLSEREVIQDPENWVYI
jgi:hypothetical protein